MGVKASNQITLIDLTDGYSVILTNDNYTFIGDTDSVASTQTTTCQIQALCGSEQVACTVGTISCPTGLSIVSDGKTPIPTLTITATSALTTSGSVTIPVTIGDITISKVFSYSIAFKGATGSTGATGKGIKSTAITYQASSSGTTTPTGEWSSSIPSVSASQYLWTKTVITYTDNTTSTSYSVGMMGATGSKGDKGDTGATGNGIKSTAITYQVGSSGTTAPTGTWSSSVVATSTGQYLWTRTIITYTDNTTKTSYSVSAHGSTGAKGDKGDTGSAGADAITMVIISSGGNIFKNTAIATTLSAHVYKAGVEVTGSNLTALGTIKWYKDGGTTAVATGSTLTISAGDVSNNANYTAQLEA